MHYSARMSRHWLLCAVIAITGCKSGTSEDQKEKKSVGVVETAATPRAPAAPTPVEATSGTRTKRKGFSVELPPGFETVDHANGEFSAARGPTDKMTLLSVVRIAAEGIDVSTKEACAAAVAQMADGGEVTKADFMTLGTVGKTCMGAIKKADVAMFVALVPLGTDILFASCDAPQEQAEIEACLRIYSTWRSEP